MEAGFQKRRRTYTNCVQWSSKLLWSLGSTSPSPNKGQRRQSSKWYLIGETKVAQARRICLKLGDNTIGRSSACDFKLPSTLMSTQHCILKVTNDEIILHDKSTNGTYINNSYYLKNRQIVSENDLIGFGVATKPCDFNNPKAFVYRVIYFNAPETITLCDDDTDSEPTPRIKQEPSQNDFKQVIELDDSDAEVNENGNETDKEEDSDREGNNDSNDNNSNFTDSASTFSSERLEIGSSSSLQSKIKDEVSWFSYEYDRSVNQAEPNETQEQEVIELDDDDDDVILVSAPPTNSATRKRPFEKVSPEKPATVVEPQTSTLNGTEKDKSQVTKESKVDDTVSETIRVNPELIMKNSVKPTILSRANKLCLDMLNVPYDNMAISKRPRVDNKTSSVPEPAQPVENRSTKLRLSPIDESSLPKFKSYTVNSFVSEVTGWLIGWLLDKNEEPNVNGIDYIYKPIVKDFDSLQDYQNCFRAYLKLELWHTTLHNFMNDRCGKFTFTKLIGFQYLNRGHKLERFVYKCEVEEKHLRNSTLNIGDFVVVTQSRGRFFAYISDLNFIRKNDSCKLVFTMEASKTATNEHITADTKHFSIRNIVNIRYELDVINSIMHLNVSPLCEKVFLPKINDFFVQADENRVVHYEGELHLSQQQREAFLTVYQRVVHSLYKTIPTIQLVEGGSGTGKTTLVWSMVKQHILDRQQNRIGRKRILVCAVSNECIDQITSKLKGFNDKIVRFGNYENVQSDLHEITIKCYESKKEKLKELDEADIICTTVGNCINLYKLTKTPFDLCVTDEASLCSEFTMLTVLRLHFQTLVLAGDAQLNVPSITSPKCRSNGLARSLFNRIILSHGNDPLPLYPVLTKQYRMHPEILEWPNTQFYSNKLYSAKQTEENLDDFPFHPYTVFDVDSECENVSNKTDEFYEDEGELAVTVINILRKYADQKEFSYGIVTAYLESKELIDKKFRSAKLSGVEVGDFHCLQSTEKDIIIILATKSEPLGFLNRLHSVITAVTRAKKSLVIFANFSCIDTPVWRSLLQDARQRERLFNLGYKKVSNEDLLGTLIKHH